MKEFNVIYYNINKKKFEPYNIIPYLVNTYYEKYINPKPKTFKEFKDYIKSQSMYQWWSKCEYEIILSEWPTSEKNNKEEKWDIYKQILLNLDIITYVVKQEIKNKEK